MTSIFEEYTKKKEREAEERKASIAYSDYIDTLIGAVGIPCETLDVRPFYLEDMLKDFEKCYDLEVNPDFQRGHVWSIEQKIAYIENMIRGAIGTSGRIISFNCPSYKIKPTGEESDIPNMVCIDGLQRLTALREFLKGDFKVFKHINPENGGVGPDFFEGTRRSLGRVGSGIQFQIFDMLKKRDVLDYYIAFNSAGTAHTREELERVIKMRMELE